MKEEKKGGCSIGCETPSLPPEAGNLRCSCTPAESLADGDCKKECQKKFFGTEVGRQGD